MQTALKIRLAFFHPDKCAGISRNEAHVRLLGSTWYMSKKMKYPACFALGISGLSALFGIPDGFILRYPGIFSYVIFTLLLSGTVLLVSFLTTRAIEKSLHYQRVQEIIWVLETAYSAFQSEPHRLTDICPEFISGTISPSPVKLPNDRETDAKSPRINVESGPTRDGTGRKLLSFFLSPLLFWALSHLQNSSAD